jgi:MFS family permease
MFIKIENESIQKGENNEKFFVSFKQGFTFIKSLPEFFMMIGVAVIANFALSPVFSVALPVVILQDFGISEDIYGILTSLMMIGSFIAPMFAVKIIKKHHYSKLVSAILSIDAIIIGLVAICSIGGLFPSIWINIVSIIVLLNVLIMTVVVVNLGITTARQLMVPGDMMGRVSGVLASFGMMATPIGQAIMGSLLDTSKSYIIIAIYACLLLLSGIIAKIGFTKLAKSGKMDMTIGVTQKEAKVVENVG